MSAMMVMIHVGNDGDHARCNDGDDACRNDCNHANCKDGDDPCWQ